MSWVGWLAHPDRCLPRLPRLLCACPQPLPPPRPPSSRPHPTPARQASRPEGARRSNCSLCSSARRPAPRPTTDERTRPGCFATAHGTLGAAETVGGPEGARDQWWGPTSATARRDLAGGARALQGTDFPSGELSCEDWGGGLPGRYTPPPRAARGKRLRAVQLPIQTNSLRELCSSTAPRRSCRVTKYASDYSGPRHTRSNRRAAVGPAQLTTMLLPSPRPLEEGRL